MGILFGGNRCRIAFAGWLPSGIPGASSAGRSATPRLSAR
ncbi:hypothetical protein BZL30_3146 [Mycobacterium kansasii]|uniref:Uncharacterized protein n=1 Tax=Mycobacterium kansasii TaxID=1768 RepID=A0A1V3XBJ9_MYCKA|nr:hypothetical protein BZL30_3146 [Mycobacterium kansasii]